MGALRRHFVHAAGSADMHEQGKATREKPCLLLLKKKAAPSPPSGILSLKRACLGVELEALLLG